MTVREALIDGAIKLENLDSSHLDTALLLAHACGITRESLYMRLSWHLGPEKISIFNTALERRITGEPVAWITGKKEFWDIEFKVGPGVLCPRPDSETLVETALEMIPTDVPLCLHDCCTGPGTLALSIAAERPLLQVTASDISDAAEHYFNLNNELYMEGRIPFYKRDLLDGINGPFDIIVSNPPYLTPNETAERIHQGWLEPELALNGGGNDGLAIIDKLIRQAASRLAYNGILILEAAPLQIAAIKNILVSSGFHFPRVVRDLGGHDRVIHACIGENE